MSPTLPEAPDWRDRITSDPEILVGKPVVRGTLISVESVVDLLSRGWAVEDVLKQNPRLKPEDVRACLSFAREVVSKVVPSPAFEKAREVEIPEAVFLKLQDLGRRFPNTDEPGDDEL